MDGKVIKKLYYSISEVSQITGLKKYVLRYWETEFPELRPGKNRAGNRIYRLNDIRTIFLIKKLLYQDKYTIEGAKRRLRELKKAKDPQLELTFEELRREDLLHQLRKDLQDLLAFLDNPNAPFGSTEEADSESPQAEETIGVEDEAPHQEKARLENSEGEEAPQSPEPAAPPKPPLAQEGLLFDMEFIENHSAEGEVDPQSEPPEKTEDEDEAPSS